MTERCGDGYPDFGLACILAKGHASPVSPCFAIRDGQGYYLYQDGRERVPEDRWPEEAREWNSTA